MIKHNQEYAQFQTFSGSAMFTMMAEGNNQSSMSFGLAKIFEVDTAGKDIDEVTFLGYFKTWIAF